MYIIIYIYTTYTNIYICPGCITNEDLVGDLKPFLSFFARRGANQELVVYNVASNFVQNIEIQCEAQ